MKFGMRKPSLKRSLKARTTGKLKRSAKRAVVPGYGKKGMGWLKNPHKASYNAIYHRTTFGLNDLFRKLKQSGVRRPRAEFMPFMTPSSLSAIKYIPANALLLQQPHMSTKAEDDKIIIDLHNQLNNDDEFIRKVVGVIALNDLDKDNPPLATILDFAIEYTPPQAPPDSV